MNRQQSLEVDIKNHIRAALNDAALLLKEQGREATLQDAVEFVAPMVNDKIGPFPGACKFQADHFPFEYGSASYVGEILREMDPEIYDFVGPLNGAPAH